MRMTNNVLYFRRGRDANVYVFALKLKKFIFSNELIETGNPQIDDKIIDYYPRTRIIYLVMAQVNIKKMKCISQMAHLQVQQHIACCSHFCTNTHIDVIRVQGTFTSASVIGNTSNATFTVSTSDDTATMNTAFEDTFDNLRIETGVMVS